MNFGKYTSHAISFQFISDKILPIDMLYFKSVSMLMHDVYNNMTPLNISNLFISAREVNKCNTRFSSGSNFYVKNSRLDKLHLGHFQEQESGYGIVYLMICVILLKTNSRENCMRMMRYYYLYSLKRMIMLISLQ
jgi:hypothetical protein